MTPFPQDPLIIFALPLEMIEAFIYRMERGDLGPCRITNRLIMKKVDSSRGANAYISVQVKDSDYE